MDPVLWPKTGRKGNSLAGGDGVLLLMLLWTPFLLLKSKDHGELERWLSG